MIRIKTPDGTVVSGLYRDPNSGIVVNDQESYDKYLAEKAYRLRDANKVKSLEDEISELKSLVKALLNK